MRSKDSFASSRWSSSRQAWPYSNKSAALSGAWCRASRRVSSRDMGRKPTGSAGQATKVPLGGHFQKILQQLFAVVGEDAFRMELNSVNGQLLVANPHDLRFIISRHGGDFKAIGHTFLQNQEGMIAGRF